MGKGKHTKRRIMQYRDLCFKFYYLRFLETFALSLLKSEEIKGGKNRKWKKAFKFTSPRLCVKKEAHLKLFFTSHPIHI